ncbi:uncharacterized protein LOC111643011 [Copidosoma floridanum]|uniref:uncharacterized protein LOC111643011 n=1 Tax=Copidosoma floridanum TaxID=29053 RepID=UPI000C6FAB40|nr:uncharacterized protein LOC111643011 [Copidosoma floridanum]
MAFGFYCTLVGIALCFNGALGIKCYECDSKTNKDCLNVTALTSTECQIGGESLKIVQHFNSSYRDAGTKEWACMKGTTEDKNVHHVQRACIKKSQCMNLKNAECCYEDVCNSSFKTNVGLFTLAASLMFITLFYK